MKVKDFRNLDLKGKGLCFFECNLTIEEIWRHKEETGKPVRTNGPAILVAHDEYTDFIDDFGTAEVAEFRKDKEGFFWMRLKFGEIDRVIQEFENDKAFA